MRTVEAMSTVLSSCQTMQYTSCMMYTASEECLMFMGECHEETIKTRTAHILRRNEKTIQTYLLSI